MEDKFETAEDVACWLEERGFSNEIADSFIGIAPLVRHILFKFFSEVCLIDQAMDGEAISTAFATVTGPDCLREVIPILGVHLKNSICYFVVPSIILACFYLLFYTYIIILVTV